jgi:hypothetical protein
MPRTCTVCRHPQRGEIDRELLARPGSFRDIAGRRRLSKTALHRHAAEHIPADLVKAQEAQHVARADDLLVEVMSLHGRTEAILQAAEEEGDLRTALAGIREARGNLELLARLLHEIGESPTVNVLVSPEWQQIQAVILRLLAPHPALRLRVAEAIASLNGGNGAGH